MGKAWDIIKFFLKPISILASYLIIWLEGKKSERTKNDAMLLDDVITAEKINNDIDNLSDADVNEQLRPFERRKRKKQSMLSGESN